MSATDHQIATGIDLGVTNKFWQVDEFTNMESTNNEHHLYILSPIRLATHPYRERHL